MRVEQIRNLYGSARDISAAIDSRIMAEAIDQVQYNLRSAYESFGFRYTAPDVASIANEVATEVRNELDSRISPNDSDISLLIWRSSLAKSHKFIHSL